jgi:hypothetical protein
MATEVATLQFKADTSDLKLSGGNAPAKSLSARQTVQKRQMMTMPVQIEG